MRRLYLKPLEGSLELVAQRPDKMRRIEDLAPGGGYRVRIPLPVADADLGLITRVL